METSLPGAQVVRVLERLKELGRVPEWIVCDNGPEFSGRVLDQWAFANDVRLHFITPQEGIILVVDLA